MVRVSDFNITQQRGINLVCFACRCRFGFGVNGSNTHITHDTNDALTVGIMPPFLLTVLLGTIKTEQSLKVMFENWSPLLPESSITYFLVLAKISTYEVT
ncbi:hypothetical protein THF1D04_470001 [Vibrio owensii]|uniref:Uncharacterized protein n=1 Tax=Vibrio owensii TaxID=696485 RepID=A0AAU9Q9C6_9VIBR|nr:hypothetical protein THF1D04_470001 [Vibrio owensii]